MVPTSAIGPWFLPAQTRALTQLKGRVDNLSTAGDLTDYWRAMASEAFAFAADMTDPESKRAMLEVAAAYEALIRGAPVSDTPVADSGPAAHDVAA